MLKSSLRPLRQSAVVTCIGFAALAGSAHAQQQPTPPEHYTLDPRGVDLISGNFTHAAVDVVIGQPGQGGIVHGRVYANGGWRDMLSGTIAVSGSTYVVSLGAESEAFTLSGSVFTPVSNNGAMLTQSGSTLTFTTSSGSVATYSTTYSGNAMAYQANGAVLTEVRTPPGEVTTYAWQGITYCRTFNSGTQQCLDYANASRLQSVRNNRGYQVNFTYAANVVPTPPMQPSQSWLRRTGAVGFNLANEYCDPYADSCPGLTGPWPRATYASTTPYGTVVMSVTDQASRVTNYTYTSGALTGIRLPGSATNDVTIAYNTGRVSSVTDASGSWTYGYADVGTTRTTTAAGPLGQQVVAVSNLTIGRATSVANALGNTVRYQYDGQRRVTRVTAPDGTSSGGYVQLAYDGRGNVTSSTAVRKVGSGLSNVVTSAVYPASCTSPGVTVVTCNRPTSATDGRGAVTDYVWNTSHGGLESTTEPAPTVGATRPQTRIAYAAQTAWYKNSVGTIVAAPSSITLPTSTSACATGTAPSCVGTTSESRTTVIYGASGVANNLVPTRATSGDGTGALAAITAMTYDRNGDVVTIDGPLGSGGSGVDLTTYRYDNARRLTGVIGPDPDGGGVLLNRAVDITLNNRDQPELIRIGTTSGVNWPSFTTLQRQSAVYGTYGRALRVADETAAGTVITRGQFSYDAAGRIDCTAMRMNPNLWGALPGSACTLQTAGDFGPDRVSQTSYDAAGRVSSITSGLGSTTPITEGMTYTANGQVATLVDGRSSTTAFEYDGFDRLRQVRYPDPSTGAPSATDDELSAYDANSNPVTFTTRANQVFTTTFDALNRATAVAAPSPTPSTSFAYDNLDRPTQAAVPGLTTTMTWDALSRQLTEVGPTGTMTYSYDVAGRQINQFWPDGFVTGYVWNDVGEMIYINAPSGTIAAFAYDDLGRRTVMARSNGISTTYGYDGISRLNALNHLGSTNVSLAFGHNPANQIVIRTMSNSAYAYAGPTGTTNYTLDRQNRIVGFGYDSNGNLASDGVRTYGYDAANRLTGGGSPAGSLSYDGLGRLDVLAGTGGGRFVYSGVETTALADPSTNVISNHFVRGPGVDEIVASFPTAALSSPQFWMLDERNSLMAVTDIAGATPYANGYDEYGNPRAGNAGRFQYTGQLFMPDFGSYHYKARTYAPGLGRFLQTDPIGYAAGANLYGYVSGDPINLVDPLGLDPRPGVTWVCTNGNCNRPSNAGDISVTGCASGWACYSAFDWARITSIGVSIANPGPGSGIRALSAYGPHDYSLTVPNTCPANEAMRQMGTTWRSAPAAPAVQWGQRVPDIRLAGSNPITQTSSSDRSFIRNRTQTGHWFHSGTVDIRASPTATGSNINIRGVGTGDGAGINVLIGVGFFGASALTTTLSCSFR